jgi:hypothetical protein
MKNIKWEKTLFSQIKARKMDYSGGFQRSLLCFVFDEEKFSWVIFELLGFEITRDKLKRLRQLRGI